MNFSEEWKSQFAIGKDFNAPLLLSTEASRSILGPLFFSHTFKSPTQLLFSSPLLSPPLFTPPPHLSLTQFLCNPSPDSGIPLSTASSIASLFGPQHWNDYASAMANNRLQVLLCPTKRIALLFFPTGSNNGQIGYLVLSLNGKAKVVGDTDVIVTENGFNLPLLRILVNPIGLTSSYDELSITIGYVMAYTLYSVHWYRVKINKSSDKPVLSYMGSKLFKTCSIVGACWSSHLSQESVVLLKSGELFFFDTAKNFGTVYKGTKLKVSLDHLTSTENCKWLGCEFSWHPRILIVARSDAVFLVDFRFDQPNMTCLAKIDTLSTYSSVENEQFLAFSKAEDDGGFRFVLASNSLLFLFDIRQPMMPLLQWAHAISKPSYVNVFKLSQLRSQSRVDKYDSATAAGSCILLGSFWSSEFVLVSYGPPLSVQRDSMNPKNFNSFVTFNAWELPSHLMLSGRECRCGNCLVREEFVQDALPEWIEWQQSKEIVLGFCILNKDLSSSLVPESDDLGGFTLVRLMSSGKLEAQRFSALWDLPKDLGVGHSCESCFYEDNLLYSYADDEYKFHRRFKYKRLKYLIAHLNGNLSEVLDSSLKKQQNPEGKDPFNLDMHEYFCEKLKVCGFGRFRSSPAISVVFEDINIPTSILELSLRQIWAGLPIEVLMLAFSTYSEFTDLLVDKRKIPLEFLTVPDLPQLPPFFLRNPSCRSSRWNHRVEPSSDHVGPILPLPILLKLLEFRNGYLYSQNAIEVSPKVELSNQCKEVLQATKEMVAFDNTCEFRDVEEVVSLSDEEKEDWVDTQKPKPFIAHRSIATNCLFADHTQRENCLSGDETVATTLISKVRKKESASSDMTIDFGADMFDDLCPIELKFEVNEKKFGSKELKTYDAFKKQFSLWQKRFDPTRDFCARNKLE